MRGAPSVTRSVRLTVPIEAGSTAAYAAALSAALGQLADTIAAAI